MLFSSDLCEPLRLRGAEPICPAGDFSATGNPSEQRLGYHGKMGRRERAMAEGGLQATVTSDATVQLDEVPLSG